MSKSDWTDTVYTEAIKYYLDHELFSKMPVRAFTRAGSKSARLIVIIAFSYRSILSNFDNPSPTNITCSDLSCLTFTSGNVYCNKSTRLYNRNRSVSL